MQARLHYEAKTHKIRSISAEGEERLRRQQQQQQSQRLSTDLIAAIYQGLGFNPEPTER